MPRREIAPVVVVRLDRLARSLVHMARLGEELQQVGVDRRTLDRVRRLRGSGDSIRVIAEKLDLSRSVVGRAVKQLA